MSINLSIVVSLKISQVLQELKYNGGSDIQWVPVAIIPHPSVGGA